MRDLKYDLKICNAATSGPWFAVVYGDKEFHIVTLESDGKTIKKTIAQVELSTDVEFIIESRTGWPATIKRALAAEEELKTIRIIEDITKKKYNLNPDVTFSDLAKFLYDARKERDKLHVENKRLRELLGWTLEFIDEISQTYENGTPKHICGYIYAPDTGYCEVCEKYWDARAALNGDV